MTEKQKYVEAYLDGYFSDKKMEYGFKYFRMLEKATKDALKKWKKYEELKKQNYIKTTDRYPLG